jgi:hypothetical protein
MVGLKMPKKGARNAENVTFREECIQREADVNERKLRHRCSLLSD